MTNGTYRQIRNKNNEKVSGNAHLFSHQMYAMFMNQFCECKLTWTTIYYINNDKITRYRWYGNIHIKKIYNIKLRQCL